MDSPVGKVAKTSQVEEYKESLEWDIEILHEAIGGLESRLAPVLSQPDEKPKEGADSPDLVPMANFLRAQSIRIKRATDMVRELSKRCEL